jgi:iron complex transport system substrate-binding protein
MRLSRTRRLVALTAVLATAVTACSSDPDDDNEGTAGGGATTPAAADAFPVTLEHALGKAEIAEEPQRVVAWGWGAADAAIALGVVPVAIPFQAYGGDEQGVLPWIKDRLAQDGQEVPTVLPNVPEAPIEAIAAAEPDLILAPYSGVTESEYGLLSEIAPTVAYPGEPWATPWRDTIKIVGEALGRSAEADELLADIEAQISEQVDAHPELQGKTVAMVWNTPDAFYVYKPADARVEFAQGLGMQNAPSVAALESGEETFYYTLSTERLSELTSDVLVSFADTDEASKAFLDSAPAKLMEQVQQGRVAEVVGAELVAAVSPPTALSLTWGLEDYVEVLSRAAKAADAT